MTDIKRIAEALGRAQKTPGGYVCQCPCHDDNEASLSLKNKSDGQLVVNCFAGCEWAVIKKELEGRGLLEKFKPEKKQSAQNGQPITYSYKDRDGKEVFFKLRFPNKKFVQRSRDSSGNIINNISHIKEPPLYNLPHIVKADVVYLCEGEKDADTLIRGGLCGTTNHSGAIAWASHFTAQLKGKTVVICQDNDEAGKKRTAKLIANLKSEVKELRLFEPPDVPEKGDVTDWVEKGGDTNKILSLSKAIGEPAGKKATRQQYFELFERVLKNPRKCIFSGKLMTFESDLWNPCVNYLDVIKSEAAVHNETSETKFSMSLVQPHFFAYEQSKNAEFLVDLPEWDGRDRISEMAYLVKLKESAGVSEIAFSELLKEWCSLVFRRLENPMIQNRIMVLQGSQGAGKDTWISMLMDGLGQFAVPLSIIKEDKDTFLNLHRGLVMKISEFDKTAKAEVSTLKDIITAPSTNLRAPYDRDSKVRFSRCSFISSANIENILRDYTGNRRFLIFEIQHIDYLYKSWKAEEIKEWQMQCLAEMKYLADEKYQASKESWAEMNLYIERETPTDPADDLVQEFLALFRKSPIYKKEVNESEILDIRHELKKALGMNVRGIASQLRRKLGVYKKEDGKRWWAYVVPDHEFHIEVTRPEEDRQF